MPQDHFVPQTYLKHFGDPAVGGMLHGYSKISGKYFPAWPKDICREPDGDIAAYLSRPKLLGDFRKVFESGWDRTIGNVARRTVTTEDRFIIAGFMAALLTCTPGWRRVVIKVARDLAVENLRLAHRMCKAHGPIPADFPVEELAMVERGELRIDIDSEWIKASVVSHLSLQFWRIFHSDWRIVINESNEPFLTSDYPVAVLPHVFQGAAFGRSLPLSPSSCLFLAFRPELALPENTSSLLLSALEEESRGQMTWAVAQSIGVGNLNRVQVRSAEDSVLTNVPSLDLQRTVARNAHIGMDVEVTTSLGSSAVMIGTDVVIRAIRKVRTSKPM